MNTDNVKDALQDLIIRLQDAEKGYKEIERATSNIPLKQWLSQYANERHEMHKVLEGHVAARGGNAEVKTSFLGEMHRVFIDMKLSAMDDEYPAIVNEIERGASTLISDYEKVLKEIEMPASLVSTLQSQKMTIELELESLVKLKDELNAVMA